VRAYTNAANLISDDYVDTEDLDGLFSGFDPDTNSYENSTWSYQTDEHGAPLKDPSLEDPKSVFQILRTTTRATRPRWSRRTAESSPPTSTTCTNR
jgi:formate dehydrogenase major subunit